MPRVASGRSMPAGARASLRTACSLRCSGRDGTFSSIFLYATRAPRRRWKHRSRRCSKLALQPGCVVRRRRRNTRSPPSESAVLASPGRSASGRVLWAMASSASSNGLRATATGTRSYLTITPFPRPHGRLIWLNGLFSLWLWLMLGWLYRTRRLIHARRRARRATPELV